MNNLQTLFITGSSGFIGSSLLRKLDSRNYRKVYCLSRSERYVRTHASIYPDIEFIKGNLTEPETYERYLAKSDIVMHLAAITGKADPEEYIHVNSEGTEILLQQCVKSSVRHFIFISSIASQFAEIEGYYYAQSKIKAEESVRASGIPYTILRPAIVVGKDSPVLNSLMKLVKMPIVPMFGDGTAKIQPVDINDLITCILNVVHHNAPLNQTVTVAGPEQITLEEFIKVLHKKTCKKKLRLVHLPVRPIQKILLLLEKYFLSHLPVTAGQLSTFTNDGTTDRNLCPAITGDKLRNINDMTQAVAGQRAGAAEFHQDLAHECRKFSRYLINKNPDQYIQDKYIQGHNVLGIQNEMDYFNALLLKTAYRSAFMLKLADTYTNFVYKRAILRKKLLLLLAIMESCPLTYEHLDTVTEKSWISLYMKTVLKICSFVMMLVISLMLFSPLRLYSDMKKNPTTTVS